MNPQATAIIWTLLVLLCMRASVIECLVIGIFAFEVFFQYSSPEIVVYEHYPFLRPSSVPMSILGSVLLIAIIYCRLRDKRLASVRPAGLADDGSESRRAAKRE